MTQQNKGRTMTHIVIGKIHLRHQGTRRTRCYSDSNYFTLLPSCDVLVPFSSLPLKTVIDHKKKDSGSLWWWEGGCVVENEGNVLVCIVYVCLYTWKEKNSEKQGERKFHVWSFQHFVSFFGEILIYQLWSKDLKKIYPIGYI